MSSVIARLTSSGKLKHIHRNLGFIQWVFSLSIEIDDLKAANFYIIL
jgi:hypothetical protein